MPAAITAYASEDAARQAIEAMHATRSKKAGVRLLLGSALHDTRREPVGGFAGPVAPDALVGNYANRPRERRRGAGSFAGDPDQQRQGCFADADRVIVVARYDGGERSRVTGELGVRKLLRGSGLADRHIDQAIGELRAGRAVVLVDSTAMEPIVARARLDDLRPAA
jgi:hypothetical protein